MLPGRPIDVQAATILPQQRNGGLPDGTRPNTQRAREAARMADPAVPRALRDAAWEAQHLINVAGPRAVPDLIAAAAKAGWRTDDPANVAPLPASPAAQEKLAATGVNRPVHDAIVLWFAAPGSIIVANLVEDLSDMTDTLRQTKSEAEAPNLDTFCAYGFSHINVQPDGTASLCCRTDSNIEVNGRELSLHQQTFDQIWNSEYMRDARRRMVSGQPIDACRGCYRAESEGGKSLRTHANSRGSLQKLLAFESVPEAHAYGSRIVAETDGIAPPPSSIHFWFGNLCNLKCRMCSAGFSSQIAADAVHSRWNGGLQRKATLLPDVLPGVEYSGLANVQTRGTGVFRLLYPGDHAQISLPQSGDPVARIRVSGFNDDAFGTLVLSLGNDTVVRRQVRGPAWTADVIFEHPVELLSAISIRLGIEGTQSPIGIGQLTVFTAPPPGKAFPRELVSRLPENPSWYDNEDLLLKEIMGSPERLRFINFAGGEPMLHKRLETVLQLLVDRGLSKSISLYFSTNGTQKTPRVSKLLREFASVGIGVSVDGIGDLQEYIRPPSKWALISENIIRYRDEGIAVVSVHPTPQAYNVFGLMNLIDFCDQNGLNYTLNNLLNWPRHLSFDMLPQAIVDEAIAEWRTYRKDRCRPHLLQEVDTVIGALSRPRPDGIEELQDRFIRFTNDLDRTREQSLRSANPRLYRALEENGFSFEGRYRFS